MAFKNFIELEFYVNDFIEWFPGVTKDQVDAVLEFAAQSLEVV